jgi:hypothetical protein
MACTVVSAIGHLYEAAVSDSAVRSCVQQIGLQSLTSCALRQQQLCSHAALTASTGNCNICNLEPCCCKGSFRSACGCSSSTISV